MEHPPPPSKAITFDKCVDDSGGKDYYDDRSDDYKSYEDDKSDDDDDSINGDDYAGSGVELKGLALLFYLCLFFSIKN